MSGSQPGGHELFGQCTSRVAFHVLSYPASSWAVPSDGGCTNTLAAYTSCFANSEPEQNRAFACSQKLPRPAYSRKHGARLRLFTFRVADSSSTTSSTTGAAHSTDLAPTLIEAFRHPTALPRATRSRSPSPCITPTTAHAACPRRRPSARSAINTAQTVEQQWPSGSIPDGNDGSI